MTEQTGDLVRPERRPSIELQIEELILTGFPASDKHRLAAAVERELGRLLSEQGLPAGLGKGGDRPTLDAGSFAVRANAKPDAIGAQVAQAVYKGFSK